MEDRGCCCENWLRQMGSYGKLARRALETDMPVMVQVFRLESPNTFYSLNPFVFRFNLYLNLCIFIGRGEKDCFV